MVAGRHVLDLPTPEGWKAELTQATRPWNGRESNITSRSQARRPDHYTADLPSKMQVV